MLLGLCARSRPGRLLGELGLVVGPAVGLVAQGVLLLGALLVPEGAREADDGSLVAVPAAGTALIVVGLIVAGLVVVGLIVAGLIVAGLVVAGLIVAGLIVVGLVVHGDLSIGVFALLGVAHAQRVGVRGTGRGPGPSR
ncbi:hypothetical protein ACFYE2_08815 [Kocuria sp. CPCC 205300]|uniref:hypothetical protein n=1 Tax=Kocuria sabuli TaxID=3071448 RepID=UPI0036D79346